MARFAAKAARRLEDRRAPGIGRPPAAMLGKSKEYL
jgi:hypothetical protein